MAGGDPKTNGGNGGTRYLDGHIVSQGTISIGSGANVITEQGGQVDQQGGTVNVPGYWELDKSTYNFSAGGTSGAPTLVNSALNVSAPAGAGAFTYFDNKSNTLSGQIPAGVTITLQTSEAYNTSVIIADGHHQRRDHRPGLHAATCSSQIVSQGTFTNLVGARAISRPTAAMAALGIR